MTAAGVVAGIIDTALDRSIVGGYTWIGHAVRRRLPTWPDDPRPDALSGRHVIVTGASSGLGLATAAALVYLGAHVHCVVRDTDKQSLVGQRIGSQSSWTAWQCDLDDLDSVRRFSADFLAAGHQLAGIVHNAGIMPAERTLTAAGHELSMAVHVLAPVLMTDLLLPALAPDARVLFITSGGMYAQKLRLDDLAYVETPYRPSVAYARSKRAQVELLGPLQSRWPGLRVYATHPGWAQSPGLDGSLPGFSRLLRPWLRRGSAAIDTTTWLLATDDAPPGGGLWHDRRQRPTSYLPFTRTTAAQRQRLMAWVDEQIGDLTPGP